MSIASATTLHCPIGPSFPGDRIDRGFYVEKHQDVGIGTIALRHSTTTPGSKTISLIRRLDTYDGPLVGVATVTRDVGRSGTLTVFDFGNVSVPAGSRITFQQVLNAGTDIVYDDKGFGPCDGVVETAGTTPPLGAFRGDSVGIEITGQVASPAAIVVVEYFHTGFGHYVMTADPDEIAGLDAGAYGGAFIRTGEEFLARNGPVPGTEELCRCFTVAFVPRSSHFHTADPVECASVILNPNWQCEKIAFYIDVPAAGVCDVAQVPAHRRYNDGQTGAPNHRFTTSHADYKLFTSTLGWIGVGHPLLRAVAGVMRSTRPRRASLPPHARPGRE